ncbi:MAG: hypothetical protein CL424_00405 [Acidimicrobiaceae bacterium]|nr:hypothetical protein [Acidimicrobiaceae bacterium]
MGVRDRFFTPQTAKAILSWRIAVGAGVAVGTALLGLPVMAAVGVGIATYAASVLVAMRSPSERSSIDPFVLSEPWRRLIQQAQGSGRKLRSTIDGVDDGPLKQQLVTIADQLDHGLQEAWEIAKRGDDLDETIRHLDPTRLRSKLDTLRAEAGDAPSADTATAIASVEQQLATAERLRQRSVDTADSLRATQTRLDELVARASEVRVGMSDTDTYARDIDDLVIQLEALHQALEETNPG